MCAHIHKLALEPRPFEIALARSNDDGLIMRGFISKNIVVVEWHCRE